MSDPDGVQLVSMNILTTGKRVLALLPGAKCFCCNGAILENDGVTATGCGDDVKHSNCLSPAESLMEARRKPPIPPQAGRMLKAEITTQKQAATNEHDALPSTWTEEAAVEKHDRLMKIAKDMQKVGPDNAWRLRYEPTKVKTWRRTKHQVILRKKDDGTSKSWSFKFSEATDTDDEFKTRLLAAFDLCLVNQTSVA